MSIFHTSGMFFICAFRAEMLIFSKKTTKKKLEKYFLVFFLVVFLENISVFVVFIIYFIYSLYILICYVYSGPRLLPDSTIERCRVICNVIVQVIRCSYNAAKHKDTKLWIVT
jgi:hypothetical protein